MCGRYYLGESEETSFWIDKTMQSSLVKAWQKWTGVKTSGEIRPMDVAPVIASNRAGKTSAFPMRWGFSGKSLMINARVETAAEKPTYRDAWKTHRCIIPASHYFEWEHLISNDGKKKTGAKYTLQPTGSTVTWLCGLYRFEDNLPAFVILTRDAAEGIRFIHDRMPVIMPKDLVNEWIRPDADPGELVKEALTDIYAERAQAI